MTRVRPAAAPWCAAAAAWSCVPALVARSADAPVVATKTPTVAEIVAASSADEWRSVDPARTLYMLLPTGRVVIELAPDLAPLHVANILTLVRAGYFDALAVLRAQDNFVVQWGDPDDTKKLGKALEKLAPEYTTSATVGATRFSRLPDVDGYAPEVGFIDSMAAGRDPKLNQAWLAHCYGAVGVARGNDPESGNGSALYAVVGQSPRQLDRNIAVVGHVWSGMELLSSRPRGGGPLGFYEQAAQRLPILSVRVAADLPPGERAPLQVLRSDSRSFARLLDARRNRRDDWMRFSAGHVDVCNVAVPVRGL
jgi:peptidylprolyl isomerase